MEIGIITIGSEPDCDALPPAGTRARLILINYDDVVKVYLSATRRVLSISLKEGKRGYEFLGFRNDVKKSDQAAKRDQTQTRVVHAVSFVVYQVDQVQKNNILDVITGRFLAIVENTGKTNDSIELLGAQVGLEIVDGQIRSAYENGGFFTISLQTPDNGIEIERELPHSVGVNYLDGLEIIEQVLNPDSITVDSTMYTVDSTLITVDHT